MSLGDNDFGFYSADDADVNALPQAIVPSEAAGSRSLILPVNQCVEGGWETETQDGRVLELNTTFNYDVVLEFESTDASEAFNARDDVREIVRTMEATVQSMMQESLGHEINRDYVPEAYADGIVPENPQASLSDNTLNDVNVYVMPEFTKIMQETYPDIGLAGASVSKDATQLPGCYQGIDGNFGHVAPDNTPSGNIAQNQAFTGMKI